MLKRTWAIVLSLVMLVTLCPTTSVFAASKNDNLITEDFENGTINTAIAELNPSYAMTKQVADGVGKGGGKALEITSLSSGAVLGFDVPAFAYTTEDAFLSYDFKFSKFPENITDGSMLYLAGVKKDGGTSTITVIQKTENEKKIYYFADQSGNALSDAIEKDKWYKIVYVKNYNVIYGMVTDDNGKIIAFNRRAGASAQTEYSLIRGNTKTLGDGKVLVDNIQFNWFNKSTYGPSVSQYFIDRAENGTVSRNAKSALVLFDQAIATKPTAKLTPEGGSAISCTVTKENNKDYASTFLYTVSWTADLEIGKNYTLTLSGTNAQNVAIDSTGLISFTTETVAAPKLTSSTIEDGAANVLKNIGSVTVGFDTQLATMGATLTPEGGSAVACTMTVGNIANTYVVTLPTLKGDTTYILRFANSKNDAGVSVADTITFTTEAASIEETVLTENFEDNTTFATDENGYTTQYKGAFLYSDLNGAYKVEGYPNTGNALKFMYTNDAYSRTRVYTASPYVFGDNETYVFTYRVKISNPEPTYNETTKKYEDYLSAYFGGVHTSQYGTPQQSNTGAALTVDSDGKHYIFGDGETEKWYYKENTWYNAVYSVNKDGISYSFLDEKTGEELFEYSDEGDYSAASGYYITLTHLGAKDTTLKRNTSADAYIIVDDVSMWKVDTAKANHALTAEDASANANTVTFTFNQPTMITHNPSDNDNTNDMLVVKDNEKNEVIPYSEYDIDIKYTDFDKNVVTISGLEYGESYYLDYSGVKSAGGAAIASGEQTTSLVVFTMPTPAASLMDKAAYTGDNVTLDYWNMDGKANAAFIAAFYKGTTLVKVALLKNQALSANKNDVTFAAVNVPVDADGMIVYALNSLESLVPLCVPTAKVAIN